VADGDSFECVFDLADKTLSEAENVIFPTSNIIMLDGETVSVFAILETEYDSESREMRVYAESGGLDLLNTIVGEYTGTSVSVATCVSSCINGTGWEIGENEISDRKRTVEFTGTDTAVKRLYEIAAAFDAEITFSYDIDGLNITGRYVDIRQRIGKCVCRSRTLARDEVSVANHHFVNPRRGLVLDLGRGFGIAGKAPSRKDARTIERNGSCADGAHPLARLVHGTQGILEAVVGTHGVGATIAAREHDHVIVVQRSVKDHIGAYDNLMATRDLGRLKAYHVARYLGPPKDVHQGEALSLFESRRDDDGYLCHVMLPPSVDLIYTIGSRRTALGRFPTSGKPCWKGVIPPREWHPGFR
jgi:hypothetical protein